MLYVCMYISLYLEPVRPEAVRSSRTEDTVVSCLGYLVPTAKDEEGLFIFIMFLPIFTNLVLNPNTLIKETI